MNNLTSVVALLTLTIGAAPAGTYLPGEGNFDVSVWQTTGEHPFREILTSPFTVQAYTNRAPIDVDGAEVRGTYSWLGVSMTDSSCYLLSRLRPEKRRALLKAVFSAEVRSMFEDAMRPEEENSR